MYGYGNVSNFLHTVIGGKIMDLGLDTVYRILERERLLYLATSDNKYPDNSAVCFAYDESLHLYFGSYSDTLKCRNIAVNPHVAICVGTLQIHGIAKIVPYGSAEYENKRELYDRRFPKYKSIFERIDNELYEVSPLIIWNYNTSLGEMNRDELILDLDYYQSIVPYKFHKYDERSIK
jgi:Pyridoxamine 5''-phosphate oxidase.